MLEAQVILPILFGAVVVALLATRDKSENHEVSDPRPANPWGLEFSEGCTVQPHPDGWAIDVPVQDQGHLNYVTKATGALTGKTRITMRYRLECDDTVRLVPTRFPKAQSMLTLYFQRAGDDLSAQGEMEAYRWYASTTRHISPTAGEHTITATLDQSWSAVLTSTRENNRAGFDAALAGAARVGFVLGGGDGLGHGVYATGPCRLVVLSYEVS